MSLVKALPEHWAVRAWKAYVRRRRLNASLWFKVLAWERGLTEIIEARETTSETKAKLQVLLAEIKRI